MNKHFLKKIRDNIPEPVKYITAPVFRNKLIRHKGFREYYRLLQNSGNIGEEEIYAFQLRQLQLLLQYAYTNVAYYNILFDKIGFDPAKVTALTDIERIPFLTKQIIRENFDALTSRQKVPGGYYGATTGGSTGEPLRILLDYDSIFVENAFLYHFRSKLGYTFDDKVATFRGIEFGDKFWKYNPMQNELVFSPFRLSKLTIKTYAERVKKYNPQYILGYLSCIYLFARLLQESNIDLRLNLKGIFLISENIDLEQRSFLEDFFKTKTSTFYGHSERCVIAEEVERGKYKPCPFYGYTELIGQEGGYEIVGTGFLSRTMPLIRYKTGDICQKENDLISIQGRWNVDDYLIGIHNEKIFHSAFNFHSEIFKNVTNYQFLQEQKGKAKLLLIVNNDFKEAELERMKAEIDKKTRKIIDFNIEVVESLHLSKRGKFKRFVSKLDSVE